MHRLALAAVMTLTATGPGWASKLDDVEVVAGHVNPGSVATSGTYSVHNKGSSAISRMSVTCALLDEKGSPKDVNDQIVTDVGSNQTVYGSMFFAHTTAGGNLTCRASDVR